MSSPTVPLPNGPRGQRPGFLRRALNAMNTTTKVALAVSALIAALAGLWATVAAVLPHRNGGPDGAGQRATTSSTVSPVEVTARLQSCETQHKMNGATQVVDGSGFREFETCQWPPSNLADADGFLSIRVISVPGPGTSEASGMDVVDRIYGPCQKYSVTYDYGHMGDARHLRPFTVEREAIAITTYDAGEVWTGDRSRLPFYPERDEADVLTTGSYNLVGVACA